jgi:cell division protein ZipA
MGSLVKTVLFSVSSLIILAVFIQAVRRKFSKSNEPQVHDDENTSLDKSDGADGTEDSFVLNTTYEQDEEIVTEVEPLATQAQVEMAFDEEVVAVDVQEPVQSEVTSHDIIMISVHAKPGANFGDYDFLQSLGGVGLTFGEHNIFHYDIKTEQGDERLFSVAKLNKPGTFDVDNIETMNCKGLLMFIDLSQSRKPVLALDCLIDTAKQLANELDGKLFESYNISWTDETEKQLSGKVEVYQKQLAVEVLDEAAY